MPTKGFSTSQLLNVAHGSHTHTGTKNGIKSTARDSSHNTAAGKGSQEQHVEEAKVSPPVHIIRHDAEVTHMPTSLYTVSRHVKKKLTIPLPFSEKLTF